MDGIGMERHVHEVESDATHVLLGQRALLGCPLESTVHMLLDLNQVLHTHSLVHHDVRTVSLWTPAPDFRGRTLIPIKFLLQELSSFLRVSLGSKGAFFNLFGDLLIQGFPM